MWIAHHGIKGQKWGVRRFQNEDGTLTPDGIKRYRKTYSLGGERANEMVRRLPGYQDAKREMEDVYKKELATGKALDKYEREFYENDKLRDKYLSKEAEKEYEKYLKEKGVKDDPEMHEFFRDIFLNDDADQGRAFESYVKAERKDIQKLLKEDADAFIERKAKEAEVGKKYFQNFYDNPVRIKNSNVKLGEWVLTQISLDYYKGE